MVAGTGARHLLGAPVCGLQQGSLSDRGSHTGTNGNKQFLCRGSTAKSGKLLNLPVSGCNRATATGVYPSSVAQGEILRIYHTPQWLPRSTVGPSRRGTVSPKIAADSGPELGLLMSTGDPHANYVGSPVT